MPELIKLTKLLFHRCKRGGLFIYLYFPLTLLLISVNSFIKIRSVYPISELISEIVFLIVSIDLLFFYFMYVNNSVLTRESSLLFPLSNFSKIIHAFSQIFYLRIFYYLVPMVIVFISLASSGKVIGSVVFILIYTINVALLHLIINILPLVLPSKILNTNFPMFVFFALMVLREFPSTTKYYEIYNMYPIPGWIGSATNAAINDQLGITASYFVVSIFSLLIAIWFFHRLFEPQKKL